MAKGPRLPAGWDYTPDRWPPRSVLAGATPIGVGTPRVEALTSYIARLALAHELPPSLLVRYVLAPVLEKAELPGATRDEWGRTFSQIFMARRNSIDGVGRQAATWVEALDSLGGRRDLALLTLLPWRSVLPTQGLTERLRRVCPVCLGVWRNGDHPVYEPLLWRLRPVEVCLEHDRPVRLRSACPACGRSSGVLTYWGMPGRCGACGEWLGASVSTADDASFDEGSIAWQRFVGEQLGDLLGQSHGLAEGEPNPARVGDGIELALRRTGMTMTAFGPATGYTLSLVSLWRSGRRLPSLAASLRVCWVAGFDLADFLAGRLDRLNAARPPFNRPATPAAPARRRIDWAGVKRDLQRALRTDPPPPLRAVLERHGASRTEARRVAPDLYEAVRDRHAAWRRKHWADLRRARADAVRRGARELWESGIYPGRARVQACLPASVWIRGELRRVWKQELRRLGLL